MRIIRGLPHCPGPGRVITMGVFDGVHKGHARILIRLRKWAGRMELPAAVITFDDHPHGIVAPAQRPPRLATPRQCLAAMEELGVDEVFLVRFTRRFSNIPADKFVTDILAKRLKTRRIVIGRDFVFGHQGRGDSALLSRMGRRLEYKVDIVAPLRWQEHVISSSGLRRLVTQGKVALARQWMGRPYALHGVVERGEGRGSDIGLPTANLRTVHEVVPSPGIYAVQVRLRKKEWLGLCYIGKRPTFHQWGPETIETYIPGWKYLLYHKRLELKFLVRLRGERRFPNAGLLINQVKRDWAQAKLIYSGRKNKKDIENIAQ